MAYFVLVHGSGQNSSSWDRVAAQLTSRGHDVTAVDLPKSAPDAGLEDYAGFIAGRIIAPGAVVVAHSFSGTLLPHVPRLADCSRLVFFAAIIPEPGKSVREQFAADPEMFNIEWIRAGKRWFDPSEVHDLAAEFLFHDCDEETLAWALQTVELVDTRHLINEVCPLDRYPDVPTASVVASRDRTLSADWGHRATQRILGQPAIEIDAGHCPHASRPQQIAALLEDLAEG